MERILVPVVTGGQNIWLIIHGMQLAERIGGSVYILEINQDGGDSAAQAVTVESKKIMERSRTKTANVYKKEVKSEFFQVNGEFCDEILKFCEQFKITNLVLAMTPLNKKETPTKILEMINTLTNGKNCRVELVGKKQQRG